MPQKCPNCKIEDALLPARTREDRRDVDGLKCKACGQLYKITESNHLVPIGKITINTTAPESQVPKPAVSSSVIFGPQTQIQIPAANKMPITTPKPEKIPKNKRGKGRWKCTRLDEPKKKKLFNHLVAGDKMIDILKDIGCKSATVYAFRKQNKEDLLAAGMPPRRHGPRDIIVPNLSHTEKLSHCGHKGAAVLNMKKLRAGKINQENVIPVLKTYRTILAREISEGQTTLRRKKLELSKVESAITELSESKEKWSAICSKI